MRLHELMVYRNLLEEDILHNMHFLMENVENEFYNKEDLKALLFDCIDGILEIADARGFEGNLWHVYLTFLLANSENAYSKACEIKGEVEGSISKIATYDCGIIKEYFDYDLSILEKGLGVSSLPLLYDYKSVAHTKKIFNKRIRNRICDLAIELNKTESVEEFQTVTTAFYKDFGVGKLGLHKAFRVGSPDVDGNVEIVPITNITHVHLDDLIGYEIPKQKLIANTKAFIDGKKANNCLLFGDAGTGKSTCVKAILNQYYDQGLRIIEVYKHQFQHLNDVIAQIKNRNYKFIIYMDDLSFEEFEIEYKYLKAVIEGGLEKKPENVLIYATSNRRHLVREEFADKEGRRDDLHASDTVQEKLSLAGRFGESIFFNGPSKKEFQAIVKALAERNGIEMPEEELFLAANKWELSHGGMSGRTAQQFIDHLLGML
ncbi:MAG: ATP-binding protein [Eubacteriales bacterium]